MESLKYLAVPSPDNSAQNDLAEFEKLIDSEERMPSASTAKPEPLETRVRKFHEMLARLRKRHAVRPGSPKKGSRRKSSSDELADEAAKEAGLGSRSTAQKAVRIVEHGDRGVIGAVDSGALSIGGAYERILQAQDRSGGPADETAEEIEMYAEGIFQMGCHWYRELGEVRSMDPRLASEDFIPLVEVLRILPRSVDKTAVRLVGNREGIQAYEKLQCKPPRK